MGRGVTLAAVGAAVGIGGALATSRLLSSLLFGVSPTDPLSLLAVTALMIGVAAVATFVPAQTSMRIDPVIALRSDA
jgi:ABC-type antimicrobial peptide transport system permease subunit